MQRDREVGKNSNTKNSEFDSFGFRGSMFPSLFGEKDPFDDPFFSRPFGGLSGSSMFRSKSFGPLDQTRKLKGPVIKEINSNAGESLEDEEEDSDHGDSWPNRNPIVEHPEDQANEHDDDHGASQSNRNRNPIVEHLEDEANENEDNGASWSNRNPVVEHPEDQGNDKGKSTNKRREVASYTGNQNRVEGSQPQTHSVSFKRVTYGGINGAYYSATTSRRTGKDGVTLEETKQADRTTGEASHRVSRGIHDKGHSITRKLDSDGKVDTMQTLHNLNEDELAGFERAWGDRRFPGWNDTFDLARFSGTGSSGAGPLAWAGLRDPFRERSQRNSFDRNHQGQTAGGRPKKIVTINIE